MAAIKAYVPRNSPLPPNAGSPSPSLPKRPAYVPRSTTQSPSASDSLKNDAEQILKVSNDLLPICVAFGAGMEGTDFSASDAAPCASNLIAPQDVCVVSSPEHSQQF